MNDFEFLYNPPRKDWAELCARPINEQEDLTTLCKTIFEEVKQGKDEALLDLTQRYDEVKLESIYATKQELREAAALVEPELVLAINQAYSNIYKFHKAQKPQSIEVETTPGVICRQEYRPIQRVGLYIPGGSASLFSTLLMLAIPAQIAGTTELILTTPPLKDGSIAPAIAYVAELCGVSQVLKLGGVQAIAALALGTQETKPVYKIAGPGNQYVMAAKDYAVQLGIAIDLPAGPSEVLVIADASANPEFIAADLLSQAEHGADSQVIFLTTSEDLLERTFDALKGLLPRLSRRELILKSLKSARFIYFNTLQECFKFSNTYAPEHLILALDEADKYTPMVLNAGSVFLGHLTPESAGDYASGTNHTLPTKGYARNYGGVCVTTFLKKVTFQKINQQGLNLLAPTIEVMAKAEGLEAHALAATLRKTNGGKL